MSFGEACEISCGVGAIGGLIAGFSLGVWTAVAHVQPAFDSIDGISSAGASGITAAIFIFGGIEAFMAAGALAGAIATPVVAGVGAGLVVAGAAISDCVTHCPRPTFGFFSRSRPSNAGRNNHNPESAPQELAALEGANGTSNQPEGSDLPPAYTAKPNMVLAEPASPSFSMA